MPQARGIVSATNAPDTGAPAPRKQGTAQCGPTCLANAANNNGINTTKGEVVALAGNSGSGASCGCQSARTLFAS